MLTKTIPQFKTSIGYQLDSYWDLQVILQKDITFALGYSPSKYFDLHIEYNNAYISKPRL